MPAADPRFGRDTLSASVPETPATQRARRFRRRSIPRSVRASVRLTGVCTPRGLQGRLAAALALSLALWMLMRDYVTAGGRRGVDVRPWAIPSHRVTAMVGVM